jgi:hypothetical protein
VWEASQVHVWEASQVLVPEDEQGRAPVASLEVALAISLVWGQAGTLVFELEHGLVLVLGTT